jgi:hypothetical protein
MGVEFTDLTRTAASGARVIEPSGRSAARTTRIPLTPRAPGRRLPPFPFLPFPPLLPASPPPAPGCRLSAPERDAPAACVAADSAGCRRPRWMPPDGPPGRQPGGVMSRARSLLATTRWRRRADELLRLGGAGGRVGDDASTPGRDHGEARRARPGGGAARARAPPRPSRFAPEAQAAAGAERGRGRGGNARGETPFRAAARAAVCGGARVGEALPARGAGYLRGRAAGLRGGRARRARRRAAN